MAAWKSAEINSLEAWKKEHPDGLIIDVRHQNEFENGHLPGAMSLVREDIIDSSMLQAPADQPLFIYCRSGRRSKEAAALLSEMGWSEITEGGGILDWKGPLEF